MGRCDVCGTHYDKSFELIAAEVQHTFNFMECAIQGDCPNISAITDRHYRKSCLDKLSQQRINDLQGFSSSVLFLRKSKRVILRRPT